MPAMRTPRALRTSLLSLLGIMIFSSVVSGQAAVPGPAASVLTSSSFGPLTAAALQEPRDSLQRDVRPTHWKEGALVGGLIGLVGGALLGAEICRNSEQSDQNCTGSVVGGALISGLVLAIPGALIGGQMHKNGAAE